MDMIKKKLNLGSGSLKLDDHHNVDLEAIYKPDEVVDLEKTPWPWDDNSFTHISAKDILEHLGTCRRDIIKYVKEMYRVSENQATWKVVFPHWRSDMIIDDPTHTNIFTIKTFMLFDQKENFNTVKNHYSDSLVGFINNVDIEVEHYELFYTPYWATQVNDGNLGRNEFNLKINTLANVVEMVSLDIRVHKPGRYWEEIKRFL